MQDQATDDRLFNSAQLASFFDVTVGTIYKWHLSGKIPKPTVVGGKNYWFERELMKFLGTDRTLRIPSKKENQGLALVS